MEIQYIAFFLLVLVFLVLFLQTQLKKETQRIELVSKDGRSVFVEVEVANTTAKRMKGLMFRQSLGQNEGMLFIFNYETRHTFWMMNTSIPLDAIHISGNGTVVDVIPMDTCTSIVNCTKTYTPKEKSKYVLEVNQGFAKENGIEAGNSSVKTGNW